MKTHKRTTAHRYAGRGAGHHIMIAGPVVPLIVANGTHNRQFVCNRSQFGQLLTIVYARNAGLDRVEFPPDLFRSIWLGVKGFIMCRATVKPDEDTRGGLCTHDFRLRNRSRSQLGRIRGKPPQSKKIRKAQASGRRKAKLQAIAATNPFAIIVDGHKTRFLRKFSIGLEFQKSVLEDEFRCIE